MRRLLIEPRPMPSFAETSWTVSHPCSIKRSLRLLILAEWRTHFTLTVSKASPTPAHSPIIENAGDLGIGVFVQQKIDVLANVFMSGSQLLGRERARNS